MFEIEEILKMFPNPGFGYTIKERLGAGHWKEAFRAYNPSHGKDVALVFFRDISENREAIREGSKLMSLTFLCAGAISLRFG